MNWLLNGNTAEPQCIPRSCYKAGGGQSSGGSAPDVGGAVKSLGNAMGIGGNVNTGKLKQGARSTQSSVDQYRASTSRRNKAEKAVVVDEKEEDELLYGGYDDEPVWINPQDEDVDLGAGSPQKVHVRSVDGSAKLSRQVVEVINA